MKVFALLSALVFSTTIMVSCYDHSDFPGDFSNEDIELITSGTSNDRMRVLNYYVYDDSLILRNTSGNVNEYGSYYLNLLKDRMYKTVTNPANPGVGIAAPQVGINKRIIWVKRYDKSGAPFECYLNSYITAYSDTFKLRSDGCLSIPNTSGSSWRAIWVDIKYDTPDGTHCTEHISHEYTAHIFQHEIDHLDGMVFLDRQVQP
ncbi:Peptide deformylase [bioreactor metagenome]|uniref:Peptide deformylase n=1 Tax=bioreactor metagenome TaxID=1076179 RepID=A0A644X5F3_9ZZZZ